MAKFRFSHIVVMLLLLMILTSVVGHYATDAVCVLLDVTDDGRCVLDGRTTGADILSSTSSVIPELHSGLDLPAAMIVGQVVVLAFTLFTARLTVPAYFFSPSPPPPRHLS